jgi:hypothetical protein
MGEILYKLSLDFSFNEWKAYNIFQEQKITKKKIPPSPLIYITMVDSLSRRLEYERISSNLQGISITRGVKINHS